MKTKTNIAVYRRANFTADVILELKKLPNVKVIHAPFEADHQLYHLYKCKLIDGVYTKDSDLYILGVRTLLIMCDGNKRHATDDRSILKRDTFVNLEDKDDEKNFIVILGFMKVSILFNHAELDQTPIICVFCTNKLQYGSKLL